MLRNLFAKRGGLAIIDSIFPQQDPFSFRNTEIKEYLRRYDNAAAYTMYPMKPGKDAWFSHSYGKTKHQFQENFNGYLQHYPDNREKIYHLNPDRRYSFDLTYSLFLAETYTLQPFLERNKVPFTFVLYPGGAFGLDNPKSDAMLKKIFSSKYFRKVIATQRITKGYLLNKQLCKEDDIAFIYGGFVQFKTEQVLPKKQYKSTKLTFDICFVAAKYTPKGRDKGYDLFIETAKLLAKQTKDIFFHVIGGFNESDIDVSEIKDRITFYGYKRPDFLLNFYSSMDIFLAPNRPFEIYEGNFDGFPLGIDAGYCGVALFVADELKMNEHYTDGKDIALISLDANEVAEKILHYYKNPEALRLLSVNCKATTQRLFNIDSQIEERVKVFSNFVNLLPDRHNL
jgi:glycosyltransferase involved in cell wall biosynthesis